MHRLTCVLSPRRALLSGVFHASFCLTTVFLFVATTVADAGFVTVSLAPVANEFQYRIHNVPVGLQTLGGVPFNIPASTNNDWVGGIGATIGVRSTTAMVLPVNVYGATALDTLINLGWGVLGSHDVTATFIGTGGANYSLDLVTGSDIRNWLETTGGVNTINGTTTTQVFQGVGSEYQGVAWIDKQRIALPASFATQTLTKFILTDNGVSGDVTNTIYNNAESQRSLIFGVTVETVPTGDYNGDGAVDGATMLCGEAT